jgi:hypothetical protein
MVDNSGHYPIVTLPNQNASRAQSVKHRFDETFISQLIRPRATPIYFQNEFGVVTKRRQFLKYYEHELAAGLPIGPHVFGLR